jgi:hypothetical protein
MPIARALAVVLVLLAPSAVHGGAPQDCKDAASCRQLATEARDRKDYDAFHDLAWKAMNLGPRNDAAAMTLLARAQSLSGRPLDAVVMLQRLAAMGVFTDVGTSDDFERVRALPSWSDLEAKLAGKGTAAAPSPAAAPAAPETAPAKPKPAGKAIAPPKIEKPAASKPVPVEPPPPAPLPSVEKRPDDDVTPPSKTARPAAAAKAAPLRFSTTGWTAVGLAYDAVSGRFIVGDRADRRLLVVGERSGRLSSLAGVDAGINELTAFEIDSREGDLWVVSAGAGRPPTVHKLQLVSGRMLSSIALPEDQGAARFTDVAVTSQSILVLDSEGRRIYRAAKRGRALDLAIHLAVPAAAVLAPVSDTVVYVAFDRGLLRADLATRSLSVVEAASKVDVSGISWMRAWRGSLVALQQTAAGTSRLVRIRIDEGGRSVRGVDVLDENISIAGPTSAAMAESAVYYLNREPDSGDVIVRKVPLK